MIFVLDFGSPRFRMQTQPRLAFRLPLSAHLVRNSVGEPKCDKINYALLLPVWQAIRSETNVCVRIEKAQIAHGRLNILSKESFGNSEYFELRFKEGGLQSAPFCDAAD